MNVQWRVLFAGFVFAFAPVASAEEVREFVSNSRLMLGTETNLSASVRAGDLDGDGDADVQ